MKNFTNNFKQFTSCLSARWLIMALMLLLGTSSAWATVYLKGSWNWNEGIAIGDGGGSCSVTLNGNTTYWFYINNYYNNQDHNHKANGTMTSTDCTDWWFNGNQDCAIETTITGTYTFKYYWKDGVPVVSVVYPVEPCTNKYSLKHDFGANGGNWDWKELTDCENNIYTLTAIYGGGGCNYSQPNSTNEGGYIASPTLEGEPKSGDECIFTFNANNNSITISKVVRCNEITNVSSNFSLSQTEYDYNGEPKKPTVSSTLSGIGTITPKYYNSQGNEVKEPTNAGTYTVKITVSQGKTYCALTTETVVDTYTINKINQSDISIANKETTFCGFPANNQVTLNIEGGDGDGEVVYKSEDEEIATISDNILTVKAEGTVIISAQKQVGTNHKVSNTATKQFTFYKAPDTPTALVTNVKLCNSDYKDGKIQITNYVETNTYTISPSEGITGDARNSYTIPEDKQRDYTITVKRTIDGCEMSNSTTISVGLTDNTAIKTDISITADKNPICYDTEAKLTCTEISDASYLWNTNETTSEITTENLTSKTTFSVKVSKTENGCTTTKEPSITINVNSDVLKPNLTEESTSICSGSSVNLGEFAPEGTVWYENQACTEPIQTTTVFPTDNKTYYAKAKDGECLSSEYTELTINVTTTPTITGPSATQPNKEITLSSAASANTWWETSGGTLTPETGAETVFTATENGNYTITAKNTDNNITCSATHSIVVNDKFYIYIRRPKSGTTTYNEWYEKTNDADKGAHPWMKNGSEYKTGDDDYTNNNYGGDGPESTFTDCNGYVWDAFIAPGTSFFIHAPNTFQEGGQEGYATFTQVTNITSTATDLYYTINQWASDKPKGTTLSPASEPNRIPEVAVPVLSINPVSGIICQGTEATITVTNPENGVSYKLNYEGKDQTTSIAYTGTGNVEFAVNEAGTYLVKAETTSGTCKGNAVSIAREIQVITTSISFEGAPYVTTPWEPITIIVNVPKGYNYTFNDTQLTQIASPDTPIKKVSGSEYTYSFPRPQEWGTGNSQTGDSWGEKTYTISATLNGVTETCGTATATVKLQDEGNDNCRTTNN